MIFYLTKQHIQWHTFSAIFDIFKTSADMCPMTGDKTIEIWVWFVLVFLRETNRCEHTALEPFLSNCLLNYQGTFSHNPLPSWYLQPFQGEHEKVISLLQHSVNTTGNVSANYGHTLSSKKCILEPLCVFCRRTIELWVRLDIIFVLLLRNSHFNLYIFFKGTPFWFNHLSALTLFLLHIIAHHKVFRITELIWF